MINNLASQKLTKTTHALGTRIVLTVMGETDEKVLDDSIALIQLYEQQLTVNAPVSEVMAVNNASGKHAVQVSPSTFALIKTAVEQSHQHFGFNALIGPLVKLWKIGFAGANVPNESDISKRLALSNAANVILNDADQSVYLTEPGMELDLGGIAKGYIADRIRDLWRANGVQAGIINLGGNIEFVGTSPKRDNGQWLVGVQAPTKARGEDLLTVLMPAGSAVTSGTYERVLVKNGHRYHHLLSPETGHPLQTHVSGVTIFARDSITCEIETKRLFFAGKPIPGWGEDRDDIYGAAFVYDDDTVDLVIVHHRLKLIE
ncbi:FAD:protein FMN transferase [Furfurilactobacillus milii]|uniref:FAD:protein FMN transferase n=1 Tax=Furfurilactobacillus milii TaxID=2888272 RepID=A0A6N9I2J8_9LACO|nr:FAD:protein FMN transferase [Furfurilactobacillus milii]MYV17221.1 FAD:protein FMN transferase [Furfurilactobacillus milii]